MEQHIQEIGLRLQVINTYPNLWLIGECATHATINALSRNSFRPFLLTDTHEMQATQVICTSR